MLEPQNFNTTRPREQLGFDSAILGEQLKFEIFEDSPVPGGEALSKTPTGSKASNGAKVSPGAKSPTRTSVTKRAAANPAAPTSLFDRSQNSLAAFTRMTMEKGSKSFSLAALLFARPQRESARLLYAWCRACDDSIDEAPSRREALRRLEEITRLTKASLRTEASTPISNENLSETGAFAAFKELCRRHEIPDLYPLELLEGMRMDVEGYRYRTQRDLDLYCYRVASVVGLMMVHVMGVSSSKALRHAVDTGLAMQMTNIARDVRDDYEMRRIYIPEQWFKDANLTVPKQFDAKVFAPVVRRLVRRADELYASGREGLKYLPFRAALAVASAQLIYREIGIEVVRRGDQAWDTRTVIPLSRKLVLMTKAIGQVLASRLTREGRSPRTSPTIVFGPEKV